MNDDKVMSADEIIEKHGETYLVCAAMHVYGGSFSKNLGELIRVADSNNMQKIKRTWPNEWAQYLRMHIIIIQTQGRVL